MLYYESVKKGEFVNGYFIEIGTKVFDKSSQYQHIEVYDGPYGKVLVIDGVIQQAELDEALYHEPLVHIPMLFHPNPKRVLILGGGDGCAVREVLKHDVEEVVLVDIDPVMVEDVGKGVLKDMNAGALFNEKVKVVVEDAREFVKTHPNAFDVVLLDLVDPYDENSYSLYSAQQVKEYKKVLRRGGVLASHLEFVGPHGVATTLFNTIKTAFNHGFFYTNHVPTFNELWAFGVFSDDIVLDIKQEAQRMKQRMHSLKLRELTPEYIDAITFLPTTYKKELEQTTIEHVNVQHTVGVGTRVKVDERDVV